MAFPCTWLFWRDPGHAPTAIWNYVSVHAKVKNKHVTCSIKLQVKFIFTFWNSCNESYFNRTKWSLPCKVYNMLTVTYRSIWPVHNKLNTPKYYWTLICDQNQKICQSKVNATRSYFSERNSVSSPERYPGSERLVFWYLVREKSRNEGDLC